MQILTALNTKLLKAVTVNVLEINYNRKVSYEIAKVLKDSGEGQLFLLPAGARKQLKSCPRATGKRGGCGGCFT